MIEVEYIFPYTIVKENYLYGIVDRTGNLVVPCVMNEIVNDKNEEIGLSTWDDFFCVIIVKDGKYGFFTNNGKFIEPAHENYAIDPCGGNIHIKTDSGYGVFASPDYIFEEIPAIYSLFSEMGDDDAPVGVVAHAFAVLPEAEIDIQTSPVNTDADAILVPHNTARISVTISLA